MVNTGKPSGACATCKARRIKCDETRPYCMRCKNSNRYCPGFVKKETIEIKNETDLTERRVERKRNKKNATKADPTTSDASEAEGYDPEQLHQITAVTGFSAETSKKLLSTVPGQISDPINNIALAYFFESYTPPYQNTNIPRLYMVSLRRQFSAATSDSPLFLATQSLALTVLAHYTGMRWIEKNALVCYGETLKSLAVSISDPELAKQDGVIMAALMVCMFEVQTQSTFSLETYQGHLRGLAILLRNRGPAQFKSPTSLGLFRAVRHQIVLRAIRQSCPLDSFWLSDDASVTGNIFEAPGSRLDRLAGSIPLLHCRVSECQAGKSNPNNINALLLDAYGLDEKIRDEYQHFLEEYMPPLARVDDPQDPTPPELHTGQLDPTSRGYAAYACYFNDNRMYRIQIQAVILRCLFLLLTPEQQLQDSRYITALETCRTLVNEICTNVAKFFDSEEMKSVEALQGLHAHSSPPPNGAMGALSQIWPLWVVLTLETVPYQQREWIKRKLTIAADKFGFQHARFFRDQKPFLLFGDLSPKESLESLAGPAPDLRSGGSQELSPDRIAISGFMSTGDS